MSALEKYIEDLKSNIAKKGKISKIEIIRYIYINLGQKMNFDLNFTFGNMKQKKMIASKRLDEEELNKEFEKRTIVCESLALIFKKILAEFGIKSEIVQDSEYGQFKHVYNVITLADGRRVKFDLEEDLEFIQTGSKTKFFGIIEDDSNLSQGQILVSEDELKEIDKTTAEYIPWGFYFDDMVHLLKFATKKMHIEEKLINVLDNLDVYVRDRKMGYRERIYYHNRVIHEVFNQKEINKIHQIDCYKMINGEKHFVSCIVLDRNKEENMVFLYSDKTGRYEEIQLQDLAGEVKSGLVLMQGVRGLRKYLTAETKTVAKESNKRAIGLLLEGYNLEEDGQIK